MNTNIEQLATTMAKYSHELYLVEAKKNNWSVSAQVDVPWEQLGQTFQQSNIDQVLYHLQRFQHCDIAIRKRTEQQSFQFKAADLLQLGKAEHERWIDSRVRDGWQYGDERNDELKLHPSIIPWEQLSDTEKQKDIDVIEKIPKLLALVGLELYYMSDAEND